MLNSKLVKHRGNSTLAKYSEPSEKPSQVNMVIYRYFTLTGFRYTTNLPKYSFIYQKHVILLDKEEIDMLVKQQSNIQCLLAAIVAHNTVFLLKKRYQYQSAIVCSCD